MKVRTWALLSGAAAMAALGGVSIGADGPKPETPAVLPAEFKIEYKAPAAEGKDVRADGSFVRGNSNVRARLMALTPLKHVGLTVSEEPVLFWFISEKINGSCVITLAKPKSDESIVEVELPGPWEAGLHRFEIAKYNAKLDVGQDYEWRVTLVVDPAHRANDVRAMSLLRRVVENPVMDPRTEPLTQAQMYAQRGIWFDSLRALSDVIDAQPSNTRLKQARADMLQKVGLDAAAQNDLKN